jgi:hypothetical protein
VSPYVVTIEQDGANVVATGSGDIDTTGLNAFATTYAYAAIGPDTAYTFVGSHLLESQGYDGANITGPSNFGPGSATFANSGSGDPVGIILPHTIYVPYGYVSDTALLDSATWDGTSLTILGLTPGTYVWTWGTDADQSYTLDIVAPAATPLPAALPLFAGGLGVIGLLGARKRRKAQAA